MAGRTRVVPCGQSPPRGGQCRSTCKTLWQGEGKDRGGDSSPLPSRGREQLVPHPLALPHGRGAAGGGGNTRREDVPHPETPLGQGCPKGCPTLAVPRGKCQATLLPWVPQMQLSPSSHSHVLTGCHRRGWAVDAARGARRGGEQPANDPHKQQSLLLKAD